MKTAFFTLEPWEWDYVAGNALFKDAGIEAIFFDHILNEENIPPETDFEIISVFVDSRVDAAILEKFPQMKHVATRSTGYDHIDLIAATGRGVSVSSVPAYGENTVAEYAFALLLALSRKVIDGDERLRESSSFNYAGLRGFDLKGKTLGVIGTGRIGKYVVKIAKGFSMEVVAYDPYPNEALAQEMGFRYASLEDTLGGSDVVTIHVPYMESTHHLLNKDTFAKMKKGAVLVNTSRGAVVDTHALADAIHSGHLGGAALDVLEEEGAIKDEMKFLVEGHPEEHNLKTVLENHALIDHPNVIVTPHNAFNTTEAIMRILDATIENIVGFAKGEPKNIVKI